MNILKNITLASNRSEVLTSFRGPLKSFPIVQSIDRNNGILRRWTVFSQGKRSTLVRYLWGKLLWDELTGLESKVFWHLSEITTDLSIYLGLKTLAFGISKSLLRERLRTNPFGLGFISRQQYLSIKGRVTFLLNEEQITLRKVPKYSGYTKHFKDKGSLGTGKREDFLSEVFEPISDVSIEVIFHFLTVGEIEFFHGSVVLHPERRQKAETVKTSKT